MIVRLPFHKTPAMEKELAAHRSQLTFRDAEAIKKAYPRQEDFFAAYANSSEGEQLRMVLATIEPGARVLDIGAGYGAIAIYVASLGFAVDAVEPSPDLCEYIDAAARLYGLPLTVYHVSAEFLHQLPAERYRMCMFNASLHHCDDPVRALTHCRRLLQPSGELFLLNEPLLQSFRSKRWFHKRLERGELITGDYGGNEHTYYYSEYRDMLKQAGFSAIADFVALRYLKPNTYFQVLRSAGARGLSLAMRKIYYRAVASLQKAPILGAPVMKLMKRLSLVQTNFSALKSAA